MHIRVTGNKEWSVFFVGCMMDGQEGNAENSSVGGDELVLGVTKLDCVGAYLYLWKHQHNPLG